MFCSNCGKKITAMGTVCNNCGTPNEPLRSFKKLDLDVGQQNQQQNTEIIRERVVYRDNPRQRKIIYVLFALLVLLVLIFTIMFIHIRRIITTIKADSPITEEYYHITGSIESSENNYVFVKADEDFKFNINGQTYETDKVYLAPDISVTEDSIDVRGRISKISEDVFMLIENDF